MEMIQPPVEPLTQLLPLNDPMFRWDQFEEFCTGFLYKLPYVKECHRQGKEGNEQEGIDIIADLNDGRKAVFSCKQYDKFTPSNAKKAVQAITYAADEYYLLLSCEASTSVRAIWRKKGANWDVWDTLDISRKIRELPPDSARSLIITHFGPEWVKRFLGIKSVSAFVSPEEFFNKLMNPNNLFSHKYPIVGREDILEQVNKFVESEEYNIATIAGRGGVGKTKILQSFSESFHKLHENNALLFVEDGVPISAESADDLPIGPCIIVLDDAHRYQDLPTLLAIARRRSIKIILSFRPYASERIKSLLISGKFDDKEIKDIGVIPDLDRKAIKSLALSILRDENAYLVDRLVEVGRDSPLVIVVGGRLLVEKKVDPHILIHDENFKSTVLDKFRDYLLGDMTEQIEPKVCRNILNLIAAVSPFRIHDFKEKAAEFLGMTPYDLILALNILEKAGILSMRGYTLRIVPDILSDHILYSACITPEGITGYARSVFESFRLIRSTNILNNLAELDWRTRRSGDEEVDLLADIWKTINEDFRSASNLDRYVMLAEIGNISYFQPERMLKLAEFALRNPSATVEDKENIRYREYTHNDVVHELPNILKNISYNLDYLPRCCDLLWQMGADDQRELNQTLEHPIRILKEIAGYDINKPYIFNKVVLDTIIRWLNMPNICCVD